MHGRMGAAVALAAGALALGAAPATAETVSALGSGAVPVKPENRRSNESIKQAIDDARRLALPLAMADARSRAQRLADGVGLQLGDVQSIEEYRNPGFEGGYGETGTFGPGQFCATLTRSVRRRTSSGKLVRRRVRQRRCFFPDVVLASVEVTYSASRAGAG